MAGDVAAMRGWITGRISEARWLAEEARAAACDIDFLGYTFRGRLVRGRRGFFVSFAPAMSTTAKKAKGRQIRAWHLNRRSGSDLSGLAQEINPQVRGWINYYGAFYRSMLYSLAARIDEHLVRWAMQKFKRLRGRPTRAWRWLDTVDGASPPCSRTGTCCHPPHAGLWEPYDGRPSRTVLRGREGEAPSRYSPGARMRRGQGRPMHGRRTAIGRCPAYDASSSPGR